MKTIGIDLGTTNSVVATYEKGIARTIMIYGHTKTPSVVSWTSQGTITIGALAKKRATLYPESTIVSNKRNMGDRNKVYHHEDKTLTPVKVSSLILEYLYKGAEDELGTKVSGAVITVPAYFNQNQKEDTLRAAELAGINVLKLQAEPTAAAIAYGLNQNRNQTVIVYDLGGGTFDISILEIRNHEFTVKALGGDATLGGDDFDLAILSHLYKQIKDQFGLDLETNPSPKAHNVRQQLKEIAEQGKIELSSVSRTELTVPNLMGRGSFSYDLRRNEYADLVRPYLARTIRILRDTLRESGLDPEDIARVICVGGSTKSPLVEQIITEEVRKPFLAPNVDEIVAHGAAISAAALASHPTLIDNQSVLPIQIRDKNVTPFSLGLRLDGDRFGTLIPKNTPLPVDFTKEFTTAIDYKENTEIVVFQGENELCSNNLQLGGFQLKGIRKAKAGEPRVEVNFQLDESDILKIRARDLDTLAGADLKIERFQAKPYEPPKKSNSDIRIGVSPIGCDNMGAILGKLGYPWKLIPNHSFSKKKVLENFDVLFVNCSAGGDPYQNKKALNEFVMNGGVLYVSDLSAPQINIAFPRKIIFGHGGSAPQYVKAQVVNEEARIALGKNSVRIHFDMSFWVPINSVSSEVDIFLEGKARCSDGKKNRPLMAGFKYGKGYVIFTAFHNHALPSKEEHALLQLIALKPISIFTNTPLVKLLSHARKTIKSTQ